MECAQEEIIEKLSELVKYNPAVLRDFPIGLPNVRMPTLGGTFFWDDLAEIEGWRMQRNVVTGHWRLLDPHNVRCAWGTSDEMVDIFTKAAGSIETDAETPIEQEDADIPPDSPSEGTDLDEEDGEEEPQ
jgi:hypothetical protein